MVDTILVSLNGKPVVTEKSWMLEKEKNNNLKEPVDNLLEVLIKREIIKEYIVSHKMNETPAYKSQLKELCEDEKRRLNSEFFRQEALASHSVIISDAELENYYEEHKDDPKGILDIWGGIPVIGIQFSEKLIAEKFLAQVKTSWGDFKKVAHDVGLAAKLQEFMIWPGRIMQNDLLRDKILALKNLPALELLEIKGTFWVVHALPEIESKYVGYQEVKDQLKQELEEFERDKQFDVIGKQKIEALKKKYDVEINEELLQNFIDAGQHNHTMVSEVLARLKGEPIVTAERLVRERERSLGSGRYKRLLYSKNWKYYERSFFNALIEQKIIEEYIVENKIDQTAAYKTQLHDACRLMEYQLNEKLFNEKIPVVVSPAEVKSWIEANWITRVSEEGETPEYISYNNLDDEHKREIKEDLEQQKRADSAEQEIAILRNEYAVKINEDYFK